VIVTALGRASPRRCLQLRFTDIQGENRHHHIHCPSFEAYTLRLIQRFSYLFVLVVLYPLTTREIANLQIWGTFISMLENHLSLRSAIKLDVPIHDHTMDERTPHLTSIRSLIHYCPACGSDVERDVNAPVNCSNNRRNTLQLWMKRPDCTHRVPRADHSAPKHD
jgi:hypothetical protein